MYGAGTLTLTTPAGPTVMLYEIIDKTAICPHCEQPTLTVVTTHLPHDDNRWTDCTNPDCQP